MLHCEHCLLPFPEREAVREGERVFCCTGCRGVYQLISTEGLTSFYQGRRWDEPGLAADPARPVDASAFREAVRSVDGGLAELDVYIDGIRCASCVWLNERLLARLPGVSSARVNYATHRARVRFDPVAAPLEAVLSRIRAGGYEPKPYSESERQQAQDAETKDLLVRLGTAFFLASQLMIYSAALYAGYFQGMQSGLRRAMELISLGLTLPVFFYAGAPFLRSAWRGLRARRFNMDSLIVLGSGAALLYSLHQMTRGGEVYFDTAAMIVTLVLAGRYVEARARGRASEAVARLAGLLPREARVRSSSHSPVPSPSPSQGEGRGEGGVGMVPLASVVVGDLVEVVPGERVPLDGEVVEGSSEVDEALLTGEARPVAKGPGAGVIGGTLNMNGAFTFRVGRVGEATVLAGIMRAVESAQADKPRLQALADRVTGWFVPAVLVLAAATVGLHLARGAPAEQALMTGVAVLVIACPCSLGLATPIAILLASGEASGRGLLVRNGDVLERAAAVTEVVLDKTGTLTRGKPVLREVVCWPGGHLGRDEVVRLAGAVEGKSEHSLARAITQAARALPGPGFHVSEFRAVPGRGVRGIVGSSVVVVGNGAFLAEEGISVPAEAQQSAAPFEAEGDTVLHAAVDGELAALLVVSDVLREEAWAALAELRALGLRLSIVSGDGAVTTAAVARRAGVERVVAEATPVEKERELARLQGEGARVLMVGDGLNDAPALTRASVGVAMGRGTDVTLESAGAVLVRDDLRLVPALVRLGRRTTRIIRQNVFWAFFYNVVAIPLAVAGLLHPIVAAGCMAASSLFVVGNSLRVRTWTSAS